MKRLIITLLTIVLLVTPFTLTVSAASNPYGKWQTIDGVSTIRCTWYAWQQAYDNTGVALPNFGNAGNWYSNAQNAGYSVGSVAKPQSIAVWSGGTYGHVSYVVSVSGNKMTVNEGGMTTSGGAAYNGDGIYNGSVCNSTVGAVKSQYSSKILVGFIYLTESTTPSSTVSITQGYAGKPDSIGETNAVVNGTVTKPASYDATVFGISIRRSDSASWEKNYRHAAQESHDGQTSFRIYFDINAEVGYYLTHGTSYTYQFFAVINNTDYYSEEMTFTTTGSHSYGAWQTVTPAACTTRGTQKRTCACGDAQTQSIAATDHSYGEWGVVQTATCTANGTKKRTCGSCGNVEYGTLLSGGHNYSSTFTIDTPATCTTAGSKSKHCAWCTSKIEVTPIPPTGHSYGSWQTVTSPTCTATGSDKHVCSTCSHTEYKTTSPLGHNYSSAWTVDKAATCTVVGTKSHHCSRCTAKKDATTIAATGHSWSGWTVTKQATYEVTGTKVRKCTANGCSATESAVIAKLSLDGHTHNFGNWVTETAATCTKNGVQKHTCSICKTFETREITASGHSFGEWMVEKTATCEGDGIQKRACSDCNETEVLTSPALGHKFGEWVVKTEATSDKEGLLERTCSICSKTETQATPKLNTDVDTSGNTDSTDTNLDSKPQPDIPDSQSTNVKPVNGSNLTKTITICSIAIGAILMALIVLVILKKKK